MRHQNLLYAHSGGVTAVIAPAPRRSSRLRAPRSVGKVFAAWRGIVGVLERL